MNLDEYLIQTKARLQQKVDGIAAAPVTAPMIFAQPKAGEQRALEVFHENAVRHFPHTASGRTEDYAVFMLERINVQERFEQKFDRIEREFDQRIATQQDKVDAISATLHEHGRNLESAQVAHDEAKTKLHYATLLHDAREKELQYLVDTYGSPLELSTKADQAQAAWEKSSVSADTARSTLAEYYSRTTTQSLNQGAEKHIPAARAEHNQQLQDSRTSVSMTHTAPDEFDTGYSRGWESEISTSTSWRDSLANAVDALGAKGIADKIRGTDDHQVTQLAQDKAFVERQGNLLKAASNSSDPAIQERLRAQAEFEKVNQEVTQLKELQQVAGDKASAIKSDLHLKTQQLGVVAERLAKADLKLAAHDKHIEMVANQPKLALGKPAHLAEIAHKVSGIDRHDSVREERAKVNEQILEVQAASSKVEQTGKHMGKLENEIGDLGQNVASVQTSRQETKEELKAGLEDLKGISQEKNEAIAQLIANRNKSLDQIDQKEEESMARSQPQNPAATRLAARMQPENALKRKASGADLSFVSEIRGRQQALAESNKQTVTQTQGSKMSHG